MKLVHQVFAYLTIMVSVMALMLFPILIIAEQRGNPLLTRVRPEETPDRVLAMKQVTVFFAICLANAILFLFFASRRDAAYRRREAEREEREWEHGLI